MSARMPGFLLVGAACRSAFHRGRAFAHLRGVGFAALSSSSVTKSGRLVGKSAGRGCCIIQRMKIGMTGQRFAVTVAISYSMPSSSVNALPSRVDRSSIQTSEGRVFRSSVSSGRSGEFST